MVALWHGIRYYANTYLAGNQKSFSVDLRDLYRTSPWHDPHRAAAVAIKKLRVSNKQYCSIMVKGITFNRGLSLCSKPLKIFEVIAEPAWYEENKRRPLYRGHSDFRVDLRVSNFFQWVRPIPKPHQEHGSSCSVTIFVHVNHLFQSIARVFSSMAFQEHGLCHLFARRRSGDQPGCVWKLPNPRGFGQRKKKGICPIMLRGRSGSTCVSIANRLC